jgi:hypothetical protein
MLMATYKLIQDIEAEDHILGPLSFRQFVFGLIAAFLGYLCFLVVVKHVAFLLAVLLPPTLFCAFFAFPFGGDQPTETWALAKLHFWLKPRRRVWNQSGIKELVTINVPKKVERVYTDGLSQGEVHSRLQALANTIDSRGWAIKHINAVGYIPQQTNPERLIDIPDVPNDTRSDAAAPADDIMDADYNPIAQQFDTMITKSSQDRRQRLMEELQKPVPAEPSPNPAGAPAQQWFMNHNPVPAAIAPPISTPISPPIPNSSVPPAPATGVPPATPAVTYTDPFAPMPAPAEDDDALDEQLKQQSARSQVYSNNLRTLQPLGAAKTPPADPTLPSARAAQNDAADNASVPMTAGGDPAILSLSNNNDLNVATLAREAERAKAAGSQDEVVISLH